MKGKEQSDTPYRMCVGLQIEIGYVFSLHFFHDWLLEFRRRIISFPVMQILLQLMLLVFLQNASFAE